MTPQKVVRRHCRLIIAACCMAGVTDSTGKMPVRRTGETPVLQGTVIA